MAVIADDMEMEKIAEDELAKLQRQVSYPLCSIVLSWDKDTHYGRSITREQKIKSYYLGR